MARKPLVAGNWKMNGTPASVDALLQALRRFSEAESWSSQRVDVVACPPSPFIPAAVDVLKNTPVAIGAQNACEHESGAYTGEVAPQMYAALGARYVILGHSERRSLYGESDALVAAKVQQALRAGLVPIVCVGETLAERQQGVTSAVVQRQLDAVIASIGVEALRACVIAYEPVWAIGTGMTATPAEAQEVHAFLRALVAKQSSDVAMAIQILYGGSVKAGNAAELFACEDIDGGLIGGASLNAEEFLAICQAAQ